MTKAFIAKVREWFEENEKYLMPGSLVVGFILDYLTLNKVDSVIDNAILLGHLTITATAIAMIYSTHKLSPKKWYKFAEPFFPILMQFSLGGLFSGLVVLYSRSGSIVASFPFIIVLLGLLIGNEFVHKKWPRFTFQVSLFYIALFSYLALIIPVLFKSISILTFILAGIVSLALISGYLSIYKYILPKNFSVKYRPLYISIGSIYILFNIFYFTNVIPPIPLSLKDAGVFHSVTRADNGDYTVTKESKNWWDFMEHITPTYHRSGNEPVYVFSSVFAPTKFNDTVFHQWSYYDSSRNRWVEKSRIAIPITGGRDRGFRGYSFKQSMESGLWRVDVETARGQVIGRIKFRVENSKSADPIIKRTY